MKPSISNSYNTITFQHHKAFARMKPNTILQFSYSKAHNIQTSCICLIFTTSLDLNILFSSAPHFTYFSATNNKYSYNNNYLIPTTLLIHNDDILHFFSHQDDTQQKAHTHTAAAATAKIADS